MVDAPPGAEISAGSALVDAYAHCRRLARAHYENFAVLSWLTPRPLRPHRAAIYAYCRAVDDLGDEAVGDRLVLLDRFEEDLDGAIAGRGRGPIFVALSETIARFDLPREPFARLIEANRIDQRTSRHETLAELLHYCEHSANPVGRLVLMLHGYRDDERFALSDATCTALQLANFWQDLARDAAIGRIYLPADEMAGFGVAEADLRAPHADERLRDLIRFQVDRARELFVRGLPLIDRVRGRLKVELALFTRGGLAVLDGIRAQDYDTLRVRPTISDATKRRLVASTAVGLALGRRRWT
jgi:squalene synthase HpnC